MRRPIRQRGLAGAPRGSVRARGLLAAALLLLVFGGLIAFMAMRQRAREALPPPVDTTLPQDITKISPNAAGSMASGLVQGSSMNVQLVDDKDPSRVQAEISAERSQPLAGNEFSLTRPRARIFLRNGRTLLVDADKGRARMPQGVTGGRPQDGLLEGNVVIRLFPPTPGHLIGDNDTPLLTMNSPSLKFDSALGRIEFPAGVTARGDQLDFAGDGLVVLYDEARKRIDGLHLDHLDKLVLRPSTRNARPAGAPAAKDPGAASVVAGGGPPVAAATAPVESLYRMVARERVSVRQGPKSITSDEVLAWMRLVDGKLRTAAVASLAPAAPPRGVRHGRVTLASYQPVGDAVKRPATPPGEPAANDEPVEIHWAGPMDAALESSTPGELARNDVFARFTSAKPGGVVASDAAARAKATGTMIEYGATAREATVAGPGSRGATLEAADRGDACGARFEIAMGTGRIRAPGEGVLHGKPAKPGEPRGWLAWKSDAEFQLAMEHGVMQPRPVSARLTGGVEASDGAALASAESLDASFFAGTSALRHVQMVGNARATNPKADAGTLKADTMDLSFEALPEGASRASRIDMNGSADASQGEQKLSAGRIIADLEPGEGGQTRVSALAATTRVVVLGKNGVTITGDELHATPIDDWAEVTSRDAEGVRVCQGLTTILTSRVQFDSRGNLVHVPAPGMLWHQQASADAPDTELQLSWLERLDYDDSAGVGRCDGATVAILTKPGLSRDILRADSAEIHLSRASDAHPRTLDTAVALGTPQRPAQAESKRFAQGGVVVDRAIVVNAARISVDETNGVFEVPAAGTMLMADHREPAKPGDADAPPALGPTSARGDTLLAWAGSMRYQRNDGRVHATDQVTVNHKLDHDRMDLACDDLLAFVSVEQSESQGQLLPPGQLISALASGKAWLRSQGRELAAGQVAYDAASSVAQADSSMGGPVTITDLNTNSAVKARHVVWNLKGDRVEADGVQQFAAPK